MKASRPRLIFAETLAQAEQLHSEGRSWADAARALKIGPETLRAARARVRARKGFYAPSSYASTLGSPLAALAIGVAAATTLAGCMLAFSESVPATQTVVAVLYPAGWTLVADYDLGVFGSPVVSFNLTAPGGVLVGSIYWDHASVRALVGPPGGFPGCPALHGYYGSPWTQVLNQTLAAGQYDFGAFCGGFGNGTVTQTIEVVPE